MSHIQNLVGPNGRQIALPTGLFINNEFVASSGGTIASIDPSTELEICSVAAASEADVDKAVKAARAALQNPAWRDATATDRTAMMLKLVELMQETREDLATLEAWDNGKPYAAARDEDLEEAMSVLRYYAGWTDKMHGQTISRANLGQKFAMTIRQPMGVCGQIIPWNYPLGMASWKLGPAIACGNTVVLKPSEETPLSILLLAILVAKAGFPPGVINIINGKGAVAGQALAAHMDVDKIAFTGSTATGRLVMRAATSNLKSITLETGGKSPLLVFDDADLEQAARWAHLGIMTNQGQICTATSRILVQRSIFDDFLTRFRQEIVERSVVGNPFTEGVYQGPQVSRIQYHRVLDSITQARQEGAECFHGGKPDEGARTNGKGFFVEPTVLVNVRADSSAYRNEIFGPVAVVVPFEDEADAIEKANDSIYGLAASVFTTSGERALRVAENLAAGMVWINSSQGKPPPLSPIFGIPHRDSPPDPLVLIRPVQRLLARPSTSSQDGTITDKSKT